MKWWAIALLTLPNCSTSYKVANVLIVKPLKCKVETECAECKIKCPSGIRVRGDIERGSIMIFWKTKWKSS